MKISDLNYKSSAPQKGTMLAYTSQKVVFEEYDDINNLPKLDGELLELHLFDKEKEYRAIESDETRFNGYIEHCADFPANESIYEETVFIDSDIKVNGKITIYNLISQNEDGTISISDYRLVLEE